MSRNELKRVTDYILDNLNRTREIVSHAYQVKDHLIEMVMSGDITEQEFYKISSLLLSQSRSPLWQNYFRTKHGYEKVPAKEDRGDFKKNGKYYEYKSSGFNQNNAIHIIQIRPWQKCDYIVQSISDKGAVTFILEHEQMMEEIEILKAQRAHGTARAVAFNVNIELRMSIQIGSTDWDRWVERYRHESLELAS